MLFQEPHLEYLRFALRSITLPEGDITKAPADSANTSFYYFLAVSSDVGELGGGLSVDLANDVSQAMSLDFSWIDSRRVFLDHTGRCICVYALTKTRNVSQQVDSTHESQSFSTFDVAEGSYVHTIRASTSTSIQPHAMSSSEVEATTLREAAERSILFRIVRITDIRKAPSRLAAQKDASQHHDNAKWWALDRARRFLQRPTESPEDGVAVLSSTVMDAFSLLNRQLDHINSNTVRSSEKEALATVISSTSGISVLADVHPTIAKLFLLEESIPSILRASGASAMTHPISQELPLLHVSESLTGATKHQPSSPTRDLPLHEGPLLRGTGRNGNTKAPTATPNNIPKLKSLISQPEMTTLKTPWSSQFSQSLRHVGFPLEDTELPPVMRVHLSTASAQVARDKVQAFVDASIKTTTTLVKKAQELALSGALTTPHGYWSREQRNLLLQLGFAPDVMRVPCSKKPHIPSVLRVAAQTFIDDFVARCTKPIDNRYVSQSQANVAGELRMLSEEQIAEFEYIDSLLYAPDSPLKSSVWPILMCEFLRLIEFHALARQARELPCQELEGVSAALRQDASDTLRQRNQACPMETVEETIVRRCKEILASSYLSTTSDVWPEDLRHFMLMLDFFPREMKNSRSVIRRDVRDLARGFLELRAQGADPKVEIAKGLMNNPAFRLTHRPLASEQILQIYLIGFPCRGFDDGVDALINFQPESSVKVDMHRYLTEYVRCHDERSARRMLRFKELLHSSYICTDHAYWPKEIRTLFSDEGYFRHELSSPVHQMLSIPLHIRSAAPYFVEAWLRDRLASVLASFPNAIVPSFPALSTLPDDNHHVGGNDETAQSQWSMQDRAAHQKDSMREDTVGNDALLLLLPTTLEDERSSKSVNLESGVGVAVQNAEEVPVPPKPAVVGGPPAYLHLSVFRVQGSIAQVVDDFASSLNPSAHHQANDQRSAFQSPVDLHAYLAHSNFAQGQLDSHSIRPVVSMALLHSGHPDSLVMASSAQAFALIDHTWCRVPPQELSSARGGLQNVSWTPVLMGSSMHTSACSIDTNVHATVFQEVESVAAAPFALPVQYLESLSNIHVNHTAPEPLTDPSTRGFDTSQANQHQTARFGDPYANALPSQANHITSSFSPVPAPRPRPLTSTSTYNRPGGLASNVRSRLAATRAPVTSRPPFSSSSQMESVSSRPMIPRTPTRPPNSRPPSFSDVIDITPPARRAGQPQIFSPVENITDTDILRMVKNAEMNAGITTHTSDLFGNASAAPKPWDRRRGAENISRARAQASLHDDFAPVSIPSSALVGGVSLSNVAGGRPAAQSMNFDMRSTDPPRAAPKALSFDDMPAGVGNIHLPGQPPKSNFGRSPWEDEVPRVKEEIEIDESLRTPSFASRRRMRDTLTMSPLSSVRAPAVARRRVETAPGFEQYTAQAAPSTFLSSARNSFDSDPINVAVPPRAAHPWETVDEQPAVASSRRQLAPIPFSVPSVAQPPSSRPTVQFGRPPLSQQQAASASSKSDAPKLTSSERVALARARREELKRISAPTQSSTSANEEIVVAVPKGPPPLAPTQAPPAAQSRPAPARSNPFAPMSANASDPSPTISSSRTFGGPTQVAARLPARNPFASQVDMNVSQPVRRTPFSTVATASRSSNPYSAFSDEEVVRQIREEQYQDEQRAKVAEETERKRRQDQLVQERLRRNISLAGPSMGASGVQRTATSTSPDDMSSVRTGGLVTSQATTAPVKEAKHRVLCEASFSVRSIVAALIAARIDLHVLHEHETAVSAILQSEGSERIRVFVVPPNPSHPQEFLPCAIIMIPLHTHNTSNVDATFSLCLRVHNAHDFIAAMSNTPLMSLPLLQDLEQSHKKRYKDGGMFLSLKHRLALLKLSLGRRRNNNDEIRVLDFLCDPFVTEARVRNLAIRFQLFNHRRSKARDRIRRQGDHQHQLRSLGLRGASQQQGTQNRGINLFVSPLEILNDDAGLWPLLPVIRSRKHLSDDDSAPTDLASFHIHHLLFRQRAWLDGNNPLVALRGKTSLNQNDFSNAPTNAAYLVEIEKLLRAFSFGSTTSSSRQFTGSTLQRVIPLYAGRVVLFVVWVVIQHNSAFLFPLMCFMVAIAVTWVHLKSLWGFGLHHRVVAASASKITKNSLSSTQLLTECGKLKSQNEAEQRVALLTAAVFMTQKLRRFLRGDSIVSSAMWMAVIVPCVLLVWWVWLTFTTTADASLTDRDKYLGLNRHMEVDYATGTVTSAADFNPDVVSGLATLELHFYTGYLLLAPYAINPIKWVLWAMFQFFMRDPALQPLHA
jgi:hypothetical protein